MAEKGRKLGKRGPAPEVLKIEGDWKDAVAKMLRGGATPTVKPKAKAKTKKRKGKK